MEEQLVIRGADGSPLCTAIAVVTAPCLQCKETVSVDTLCYALGRPYHGLLHVKCAPYFTYTGHYPHIKPLASYY